MIVSTTKEEHTLEIRGPRKQGWRPAGSVNHELLRAAIRLAQFGRSAEAIDAAETTWIEVHQHIQDVRFRVRSTQVTLTGVSAKDVTDAMDQS